MRKPITQVLLLTLLLAFSWVANARLDGGEEGEVTITEATNLASDAAAKRPILLLVSLEHCPFCMQIKRDILGPMIKSGDYKDQLTFRELHIDRGSSVVDFQGNRVASAEFAHRLGVTLTPTLLFLGTEGEELAERLVGISTPEMFFFYVDEAIKQALAKFNTQLKRVTQRE